MPISLDKFKSLPKIEKGTQDGPKITNESLIEQLKVEAMTTKEAAKFCEIQTGSAYSRLSKLEAKGIVARAFDEDENITYWGYNADYVPSEEEE